MNIKTMIVTAGLAFAAFNAHANIGDTLEKSAEKYGPPIGFEGNKRTYRFNNWLITQCFNSQGIAVTACYFKVIGTISAYEAQQLNLANVHFTQFPKTWQHEDWPDDPGWANQKSCFDPLSGTRITYGQHLIDNEWHDFRAFSELETESANLLPI